MVVVYKQNLDAYFDSIGMADLITKAQLIHHPTKDKTEAVLREELKALYYKGFKEGTILQ